MEKIRKGQVCVVFAAFFDLCRSLCFFCDRLYVTCDHRKPAKVQPALGSLQLRRLPWEARIVRTTKNSHDIPWHSVTCVSCGAGIETRGDFGDHRFWERSTLEPGQLPHLFQNMPLHSRRRTCPREPRLAVDSVEGP